VIKKVINAQLADDISREIIVVDDFSSDNTVNLVTAFINTGPGVDIHLVRHERNQGKGASIHSAIGKASGDYIVIQDADLEYDPNEYTRLLKPITDGHADVVYGSRFRGSEPHRMLFFFHSIGNHLLTFMSNLFTGLNLTDMETGFKMFKFEVLKKVRLRERRFGFEPEVTAKISRIKNIRIYEVGISYYGRSYNEGKKIRWADGLRALYCIIKYNVFVRK
jgi:glycosyltransferase involved in cell wall biosynthesis